MICCRCAILAATAAASHPSFSSAVTISEYYIDGQIATDPNFTAGVQNVDLSGAAPSVNIPMGGYFRFGVSLVLSDNPNPASGDAWDLANQAAGNVAQPQNLGIASVAFDVPSSDTKEYSLAPVLGPLDPEISPNDGIYTTTAVINPDLAVNLESAGQVREGGAEAILVGNSTAINPRSLAIEELGYFSGNGTPAQATPFFTDMAFQSHAAGQTELSPEIEYPNTAPQLSYWTNQSLGSVGIGGKLTSATYSYQNQLTTADTINPLPVLIVNVTAIQPVLSLSSSASPTTYGNEVPLYAPPPFQHGGFYSTSQFRGTTFYIAVPELDAGSPSVIVELELNDAFSSDITQFVEDLNSNEDGVVAFSSPPAPYFFFQGYNVLLEIPRADFSQTSGIAYLGLDLTQISNIPDISNLYIGQAVVLPEPGSVGLLMAGGIAIAGRRKRRAA